MTLVGGYKYVKTRRGRCSLKISHQRICFQNNGGLPWSRSARCNVSFVIALVVLEHSHQNTSQYQS